LEAQNSFEFIDDREEILWKGMIPLIGDCFEEGKFILNYLDIMRV
jgi:hypothetical protein